MLSNREPFGGRPPFHRATLIALRIARVDSGGIFASALSRWERLGRGQRPVPSYRPLTPMEIHR